MLPHPSPQLVKHLCEMINKRDKKAAVKPFMAKNYLWVFVNCLIENPAFDSQVMIDSGGDEQLAGRPAGRDQSQQ